MGLGVGWCLTEARFFSGAGAPRRRPGRGYLARGEPL